MPQEHFVDGNLQLENATPNVVVILPAVQLFVVVAEDLVGGQVGGVAIANRVLEAARTRLVEQNGEQVAVDIVADRPVQVIQRCEALHSWDDKEDEC